MNPLEYLQSLFSSAAPAPAAVAPPQEPARAPMFEEGNNAPHMILRRLLTGSNDSPLPLPPDPNNDPEGGRTASTMYDAMRAPVKASAPAAALPGNVTLATPPEPVANQAQALTMFGNGGQVQPDAARLRQFQPMQPRNRMPTVPVDTPAIPPFQTTASPAAKPASPAAADMDWGKFLQNVLAGGMAGAAMANGTPRGGGIGAFGAGYTTAQKASDARTAQENAAKKMAFDQNLALRKDTRDERTANRNDEELGLKKGDSKRKDAEYGLKSRDQDRKEAETDARIRKFDAEVAKAKDKGLSAQNVINLENLIQREIKDMRATGRSDAEVAKTERMMRGRLDRQIKAGKIEIDNPADGQKPPKPPAGVNPTKPIQSPDGKLWRWNPATQDYDTVN